MPVRQPLSGLGLLAALACRPSALPRAGVAFQVTLVDSTSPPPACWIPFLLIASVWPAPPLPVRGRACTSPLPLDPLAYQPLESPLLAVAMPRVRH